MLQKENLNPKGQQQEGELKIQTFLKLTFRVIKVKGFQILLTTPRDKPQTLMEI